MCTCVYIDNKDVCEFVYRAVSERQSLDDLHQHRFGDMDVRHHVRCFIHSGKGGTDININLHLSSGSTRHEAKLNFQLERTCSGIACDRIRSVHGHVNRIHQSENNKCMEPHYMKISNRSFCLPGFPNSLLAMQHIWIVACFHVFCTLIHVMSFYSLGIGKLYIHIIFYCKQNQPSLKLT